MNRPHISIEVIGPAKAREYLSSNWGNRPINDRIVARYVSDMKNGRWRLTNEGIGFDATGRLLDGQHRLTAIIAANVEVEMLVMSGQSPESYAVINTGRARSAADRLTISGLSEKNTRMVAAALRLVLAYENGSLFRDAVTRATCTYSIPVGREPELFHRHPGIQVAANRIAGMKTVQAFMSPGLAAAALYLTTIIDSAASTTFFNQINTGEGLRIEDPALVFRNRMTALRAQRTWRPTMLSTFGLFRLAWEKYRAGQGFTPGRGGGLKFKGQNLSELSGLSSSQLAAIGDRQEREWRACVQGFSQHRAAPEEV